MEIIYKSTTYHSREFTMKIHSKYLEAVYMAISFCKSTSSKLLFPKW